MIKKKLAKMLTTCLMSVFIIGTASMTVHAESVRETEPNNTMETAETIMANHETAAQAVSGSRPSQHVVTSAYSHHQNHHTTNPLQDHIPNNHWSPHYGFLLRYIPYRL